MGVGLLSNLKQIHNISCQIHDILLKGIKNVTIE